MKSQKVILLASAIATTITLSGCAGVYMPDQDEQLKSREELSKPLIEEWKSTEPAIQYFKVSDKLVIEEPERIPDHIRNIEIQTVLVPDGTMVDLAATLEELNIFVVIPEEEVQQMPTKLFGFKGLLGDYLDAFSSAYNVSFKWKKGSVLSIERTAEYSLKVPQDESLVEEIKFSLESYGATDVNYSLQASTVSYSAPSSSHERIVNYLEKLSLNAAVISIQSSVVTVALNDDKNKGFDWSSLEFMSGHPDVKKAREEFYQDESSSTSTSINGNGQIDGGGVVVVEEEDDFIMPGSNLKDTLALAGLSSSSASLALAKGDLYFNAALNFLSTYGNTETRQSVLMKTLSGRETGIKSADAIPYIDDVGVQGSQQGYTGSAGMGRTNVETVDVGLDLKIKPYYDFNSELITIDLKLSLSSLLGFVDLKAGNQVGEISYPRVQKQEFGNTFKLRAGEPVIVGGITFDSFEDKRSNLSFLKDYETASQNLSVSRNAMFILLRPTVTVFGNFDQSETVVSKD